MKNFWTIFILSVVLLLTFAYGSAQDQASVRGPASERIEQFKKVRLMETLKMDDETSIRFFSHYNKYIESLRAVQKDHNALIDQLQKLTSSNANSPEIEQAIKNRETVHLAICV